MHFDTFLGTIFYTLTGDVQAVSLLSCSLDDRHTSILHVVCIKY